MAIGGREPAAPTQGYVVGSERVGEEDEGEDRMLGNIITITIIIIDPLMETVRRKGFNGGRHPVQGSTTMTTTTGR